MKNFRFVNWPVIVVLLCIGAPALGLLIEGSCFIRHYHGSIHKFKDHSLTHAKTLVSHLHKAKKTIFYIHGYKESVHSESVKTVAHSFLNRSDCNVLALDYSRLASHLYPIAVVSAQAVSLAVLVALKEMIALGLVVKKLHIIGHSIGTLVAALIGRLAEFKLPRITGLDPPGPLFSIFQPVLHSGDAHFVDIIHTDMGALGVGAASGHVDFFPNCGRRPQPRCPLLLNILDMLSLGAFCSHHRAWQYFAESVLSADGFKAVQCNNGSHFSSGFFEKSSAISMGYHVPLHARGSYYLSTGGNSPFSLGLKGLKPTHGNTCFL